MRFLSVAASALVLTSTVDLIRTAGGIPSKQAAGLPMLRSKEEEAHFSFSTSKKCSEHRRGRCSSANRHVGEPKRTGARKVGASKRKAALA
jgi:hypothetical protein